MLFESLNKHVTKRLGQLVNISKSIEPGSSSYQEEGIPFVRVQDLSEKGISEPRVYLSREDFSSAPTPSKDTILLSKDGTVGIAYKMRGNEVQCITSSAILHLTIKDPDVLPEYLTQILNSSVVKLQAERDAGGSIINHWKPSEIKNVVIPILPMKQQREISNLVNDSFALLHKSKKLLNYAIRAVEIAIEQDEGTAIQYLADIT